MSGKLFGSIQVKRTAVNVRQGKEDNMSDDDWFQVRI